MQINTETEKGSKTDSALPLRIAAIQMTTSASLLDNLQRAETLLAEAKAAGVQMVVLPEYFAMLARSPEERATVVEDAEDGQVKQFLAAAAARYQLWIIGGSHPVKSPEPSLFWGRCYVFNPSGQLVTYYDKIHLFDVSVADQTGQYRESSFTQAGSQPVVFDTPWGKMGLAICYDIRFPELFRWLSQQGAQVLLLPAAFTQVTGQAHWFPLLQARAIENQCYLVAAAQQGTHQNGRQTFGHSCICSPWGEIISQLAEGEGIVIADLDFAVLNKIRNEFPALTHRRL